jgi:diaminopimelate decarboxylase
VGIRLSENLAQELLTNYGSPLYVYDLEILRHTIGHITRAIPGASFYFAAVTNGNVSLLKTFQEMGWGLHANTPGDIYLAQHAGFSPKQIVYSGSNLSSAEMRQVLEWGVTTLNFDSLVQLQQFVEVAKDFDLNLHLGLRLNFPALTGNNRIGVRPEEFAEAVAIAGRSNHKIQGLHFYRGTGTNATAAFTEAIEMVLSIGSQLPDWQYLDFGGGFGYPYRQGSAVFDWDLFGAVLLERVGRLERKIELVIEPGRSAIAGCGTLLARVVATKWQGDKQIVGVDTTVANLAVLAVHGGYRKIVAMRDVPELKDSIVYHTDVCGNTTYSRDYLGKDCLLPALQVGDKVAILDVGAYGYAMSSHFLHRPRPAEVAIDRSTGDSGSVAHRLIRRRETTEILLANQII